MPISNHYNISLIVAMGHNNVIGHNGQLLWHIKEDFLHFKRYTMGKTIIMGRKTYNSIGKALPHRRNIIITRDTNFTCDDAYIMHNVDDVFAIEPEAQELCIIGGGEIYNYFMPFANKLIVSHVDITLNGDTYFPPIIPQQFIMTHHDDTVKGISPTPNFYVAYYNRIN